MNSPTITTIKKSIKEADNIKSILFEYPGEIQPGQFYMIWIPGIDEIPMSVSYIDNELKGITFRKIGAATTALYNLQSGDKIGIRGPYGKGFSLQGNHLLFVGGGTGIAMIAPAVEQAGKKHLETIVVIGVKTKNELFFEQRLRQSGAHLHISTDDGSLGFKGFASKLVKNILKTETINSVYTCGPELMMQTLLQTCGDLPFQAGIERYMKCALGICGQCCIDKGLRVCADGPVFDGATLKHVDDFGVYRRDSAGRKIMF